MNQLRRIDKDREEWVCARQGRAAPSRPMSYYEGICAMTNGELEAEQARLCAGCQAELQKLKGEMPPMGISEDHPGWEFDTFERRSWLVDSVWGRRLRKAMEEIVRRHNACEDQELRQRLAAEYEALREKMIAMDARYAEREKLDARRKPDKPGVRET